MKVYCAGFNLYGQFPTIEDVCIVNFTKKDYNNLTDIEICHTFSIAKVNGKIKLHGYINKQSHQSTEIAELGTNEVAQMSVSDSFALFLMNSGKIWKLTENSSHYNLECLSNFVRTEHSEEESDDRIVKISCGFTFSCAYSFFGCFFNIPTRLSCADLDILDMSSGRQHCLILSKDGMVYSLGNGSRGQLGHGDLEDLESPKLIDALAGIKIKKISSGAWHCAALSYEGDLYMWGWNCNGQLGLKTVENQTVSIMATPQVINFDTIINDVACGSRHTICLQDNNMLYGCGWNKYNQLGFKSDDENILTMIPIYDFKQENIISLKCGPWNSMVLASDF